MSFNSTPHKLFVVRHLRFRRVWIGLSLLMVFGVFLASVAVLPAPLEALMVHDKLMHASAYACLMVCFAQFFRHNLTRLVLVVGIVALGIGMEFVQSTIAYRQFELLDMAANTSGVVLAWVLVYTWVGDILSWIDAGLCKIMPKAGSQSFTRC